jgi:hypothetical protein
MNTSKLDQLLDSLDPPLKGSKRSHLVSMFYDVYLEGIEEGKSQVKNGVFKLIEKMLEDN